MKKTVFFSLLFIAISSLLLSCASTSSSNIKNDLEKYNHTIATIAIHPDASIVGGSGYALLQQLELCKSGNDTVPLTYDRNGVTIRVDSLTGNVIGMMSSDILFDFGKYELSPIKYPIIDTLLLQLIEHDTNSINIIGHTDSVGTEQYNLILSQRRANAVKEYITSKYNNIIKINSTFGLGESQPIASNETAETRQLNRRVEIILQKQ